MEASAGPWCGPDEVGFRLGDEDQKLSSVRLNQSVLPRTAPLDFAFSAPSRTWELRLPRPPVQRLEYRLDVRYRDGADETICDPANPHRVGGGYGDSSELRCPGYREPDWLRLPLVSGSWREVHVPLPALRAELTARIWSPSRSTDRVLVAHDGPDYDRYGELGRYAATMIGSGRVPPFHLVLLPAGDRFEWYSASPAYSRALAGDVLPKITAELGTDRPVVGIGASLGALAMLQAQRRHPAAFGGLFLQSGSFFQPRFDRQESGFRRYLRMVRFIGRVLRSAEAPAVPAVLTCGTVEENLANNRDMALALQNQGYPATFVEVPDAHNWVGWRDALDPHLTSLLQRVWSD